MTESATTEADTRQAGRPRQTVAILSMAAIIAAFILEQLGSRAYAEVLGIPNPALWTAVVAIFGYAALQVTERRGFAAGAAVSTRTWGFVLLAGCLLPLPVIVVDLIGGFARDINAQFPDALLFYPSIALVAEMVFHVAPLAVAAGLVAAWDEAETRIRQAGYAVALLIEPVLQVGWMAGSAPLWVNAAVGLQLLVFSGAALFLIRTYGFLTAYVFRMAYYTVWHILWGYTRLDLLFSS